MKSVSAVVREYIEIKSSKLARAGYFSSDFLSLSGFWWWAWRLDVMSRTILNRLFKQMRVSSLPFFKGLKRRMMPQRLLGYLVVI